MNTRLHHDVTLRVYVFGTVPAYISRAAWDMGRRYFQPLTRDGKEKGRLDRRARTFTPDTLILRDNVTLTRDPDKFTIARYPLVTAPLTEESA